jgi:hypothetical protein
MKKIILFLLCSSLQALPQFVKIPLLLSDYTRFPPFENTYLLSLTHASWLANSNLNIISISKRTNRENYKLLYFLLDYGRIEKRDASGIKIGEYDASDSLLSFFYCFHFERSSVGINLKFIDLKIYTYRYRKFLYDFVFTLNLSKNTAFELAWMNSEVQFKLPATLSLKITHGLLSIHARYHPYEHLYEIGSTSSIEMFKNIILKIGGVIKLKSHYQFGASVSLKLRRNFLIKCTLIHHQFLSQIYSFTFSLGF